MKNLTTTTFLFMAAATPSMAELDGPLIDPAGLQAAMSDDTLQIIDIRAPNEDEYAGGHIAGAVSAPYGMFRGPKDNPGKLPEVAELQETVRKLGLDPQDPLVVTYQGDSVTDFGAAARVYWTLKSLGFEDLAILNGGIEVWSKAGLSLSKDAVTPEPNAVEVSWDDTWTTTTEEVRAIVDGEAQARLIDARPESFWSGNQWHPEAERPGTIPQSEYFVHSSWFGDGPVIVDQAAAQSLAQDAGLADAGSLISFCNTGHWAATNWFAMSELAGLEDVKLYPESMVGWSKTGYEMANVPGAVKYLWLQIKNVF